MSVLFILVPLALGLAAGGVAAFVWAVRTGQFDDVHTPGLRVILDDEPADRPATPDELPPGPDNRSDRTCPPADQDAGNRV